MWTLISIQREAVSAWQSNQDKGIRLRVLKVQ